MQQRELAIKEGEVKAKALEAMAKIQAQLKKDQDAIALKRQELDQKERIEGGKIAAKVAGDKLRAVTESERLTQQQTQEMLRQGVDLGKWVQDQAMKLVDMENEKVKDGNDNNSS